MGPLVQPWQDWVLDLFLREVNYCVNNAIINLSRSTNWFLQLDSWIFCIFLLSQILRYIIIVIIIVVFDTRWK